MSDLISRADAIEAVKHSTAYMHDDLYEAIIRIPSAETTGALDDAIAKYVADGYMLPPSTLTALPSADAVQGEWVYIDNYFRVATCSRCHKVTMFEKWGAHTKPFNYCPKCGAKMSGYVFNDDFVESEDKK